MVDEVLAAALGGLRPPAPAPAAWCRRTARGRHWPRPRAAPPGRGAGSARSGSGRGCGRRCGCRRCTTTSTGSSGGSGGRNGRQPRAADASCRWGKPFVVPVPVGPPRASDPTRGRAPDKARHTPAARVRGGGCLARGPRLGKTGQHRAARRPTRQKRRLDPWPQAPVAAQADPQRRVPQARLAQRPLGQRVAPAMRREIGRLGQWPAERRRERRHQLGRHLRRPALQPLPRPVRRCVQRPGLAVAPPGLARIARRPGERASAGRSAGSATSSGAAKATMTDQHGAIRTPPRRSSKAAAPGSPAVASRSAACGAGTASSTSANGPSRRPSSPTSVQPPVAWPSFVTRQPVVTGRSASSALTGALIAGTPTTTSPPSEPAAPGPRRDDALRPPVFHRRHERRVAGPKYWAP